MNLDEWIYKQMKHACAKFGSIKTQLKCMNKLTYKMKNLSIFFLS